MRIITGLARGCRLETLPGEDTRPTAERVKEALCSALQFEIEGRAVLDLFAGSGQMGLELLSRGAAGCVFVEKNPAAAAVVRRNLNTAARREPSLSRNAQVLNLDALAYLGRTKDRFDIAVLDPPYAAGLLEPALRATAEHMNPGGVIVCESDRGQELPEQAGDFRLDRTYRYGRVVVRLYRWSGGAAMAGQ
ncbi:MAG TPA: 16S rRNA (guanine(966)-N(2))-methyltransferase RsmD [Firmicutes bacterium]|nr:16S rRNA (guanine(966)-N(2))-methyltransferase RsmD [Bacillota bacterium]